MYKLEKVGYFLVGASAGTFLATFLYEREIRKPVGEIESYIPVDGDELAEAVKEKLSEAAEDVEERAGDVLPDLYRNASDKVEEFKQEIEERSNRRREEFEKLRGEKNTKTSYSDMYDKGRGMVDDILNTVNNRVDEAIEELDDILDGEDEGGQPDTPPEDEPKGDDDYILERVEENIEVYLDENPQDYVTLIFYHGDESLCDDREQLISNPEEVVGDVALERLVSGGPGAEEGVIFVRNLKTMINYEVVLDEGSYSETVLGIFESRLDKGDGGDVDNR